MNYNVDATTQVYYINLDTEEHRRKHMEKQLVKFGFQSVTRIQAVDSRHILSKQDNTRSSIVNSIDESNRLLKRSRITLN
jgi:hypothetical protein